MSRKLLICNEENLQAFALKTTVPQHGHKYKNKTSVERNHSRNPYINYEYFTPHSNYFYIIPE